MKIYRPLAAVLLLVLLACLGYLAYSYVTQEIPLSEKLDNASHQLDQGHLGQAVGELNNQTRGDKMQNDLEKNLPEAK